jgi:hypothetical protein
MPGEKNAVKPHLVLLEKIYLPPLHTKLDLIKNFVKGMDKTGHEFQYARNKIPNVIGAKTGRVYLLDPGSGN